MDDTKARGMWPAILPWNTAKTLADDPEWMKHSEWSDRVVASHAASSKMQERRERIRARTESIVDLFMAGDATIEEIARGFGMRPERVTRVIKKALEYPNK